MNRLRTASTAVPRLRLYVLAAAVFATALKVYVAATTRGTDDVFLFGVFARMVREHGPVGIYGAPPEPGIVAPYNHPPLSGLMLMLFNWMVDGGARFETLIRLPATLADLVTAVLLFELIRLRRPAVEAAVGAALFAWSPALGVVSGFHGNTDPVCIMFTLLAVYLLVVREAPALAGLSYALGLSIKLVPVVAGPLLLYIAWRAGRAHAVRFAAAGAVAMAVLWGPALVTHFAAVRTNVIGYAGYGPKQWGVSQIILWLGLPDGLVDVYAGPGRFLVLAVAAGVPVLLARRRTDLLLPAVGLTLALFLLLTPVHAMQYTIWPVAGLYLVGVWPGTVYSVAAGVLLAKVYSRWNACYPGGATCRHAYPWDWDQAWSSGMSPDERKLAGLVWLVLLGSIVVGVYRAYRQPASGAGTGADVTEVVDGETDDTVSPSPRSAARLRSAVTTPETPSGPGPAGT